MKAKLSPVYQRVLALALLVSAMSLLWTCAIAPLAAAFVALTDRQDTDLRAISRDRGVIADDANVQRNLAALENNPHMDRLYPGEKPETVVQQLQADVRALVGAGNTSISLAAEPIVDKGLLIRLAVKVSVSAPIDQMAGILKSIHENPKFLEIRSMTVQSSESQGADANAVLAIQMIVAGYMIAPTGSTT